VPQIKFVIKVLRLHVLSKKGSITDYIRLQEKM